MDGNDIGGYTHLSQATMFEGVLASPPVKAVRKFKFKAYQGIRDWDTALSTWTTNTLPVKSLADFTNRRGIGVSVYTFLEPDAVGAINTWLLRKGISVPIYWYPDVQTMADDLQYNRGIQVIYTSSHEEAKILGMRATVVHPTSAWSV